MYIEIGYNNIKGLTIIIIVEIFNYNLVTIL